jgi:beta-carotene hydroxylase
MNAEMPAMHEVGLDLLRTSSARLAVALTAPVASTVLYFVFALHHHWALALGCVVFLSFITYGSTSHDLVHGNLGLSPRVNDACLTFTELLALRSGHAYRHSHLAHHRHFPTVEDVEGAPAHWPLWRVLLAAPLYVPSLWVWSFRHDKRERAIIALETALVVVFLAIALALVHTTPALLVYAALVIMGTWVLPFGLVYVQHDARGTGPLRQTRRFRGTLVPALFLHHLYHLEHHLYPRVPAHHWRELSARLDPYLDAAHVPAIRIP